MNYSFGNDWDLNQISTAELTARVRRAAERAGAAEAMSVIVSLADPSFMKGRGVDRLGFNLGLSMLWEHNWVGFNSFEGEKAADQRRVNADIERYANTLHADAARAPRSWITPSPTFPGGTQCFAFTPLGFSRDDAADMPWSALGPASIFDLSSLFACQSARQPPHTCRAIHPVRSRRVPTQVQHDGHTALGLLGHRIRRPQHDRPAAHGD